VDKTDLHKMVVVIKRRKFTAE